MEIDGSTDVTHEVLVFETDAVGLITRIDIFISGPRREGRASTGCSPAPRSREKGYGDTGLRQPCGPAATVPACRQVSYSD